MAAELTQLRSLRAIWERVRARSVSSRIEVVSRLLCGRPFLSNPVGDGVKSAFDHRSVVRVDAFDCQTYVETVLAIAGARTLREVPTLLRQFRYRGEDAFINRNHLLLAQWVPHVLGTGLLLDDTARVAGREPIAFEDVRLELRARVAEHAREVLPRAVQRASQRAIARALPRTVRQKMAWIPMSQMVRGEGEFTNGTQSRGLYVNSALLERMSSGSVWLMRSPRWLHLAFVIKRRQKWWLRQASGNSAIVEEHDLVALLQTMARFELCEAIAVLAPPAAASL